MKHTHAVRGGGWPVFAVFSGSHGWQWGEGNMERKASPLLLIMLRASQYPEEKNVLAMLAYLHKTCMSCD